MRRRAEREPIVRASASRSKPKRSGGGDEARMPPQCGGGPNENRLSERQRVGASRSAAEAATKKRSTPKRSGGGDEDSDVHDRAGERPGDPVDHLYLAHHHAAERVDR